MKIAGSILAGSGIGAGLGVGINETTLSTKAPGKGALVGAISNLGGTGLMELIGSVMSWREATEDTTIPPQITTQATDQTSTGSAGNTLSAELDAAKQVQMTSALPVMGKTEGKTLCAKQDSNHGAASFGRVVMSEQTLARDEAACDEPKDVKCYGHWLFAYWLVVPGITDNLRASHNTFVTHEKLKVKASNVKSLADSTDRGNIYQYGLHQAMINVASIVFVDFIGSPETKRLLGDLQKEIENDANADVVTWDLACLKILGTRDSLLYDESEIRKKGFFKSTQKQNLDGAQALRKKWNTQTKNLREQLEAHVRMFDIGLAFKKQNLKNVLYGAKIAKQDGKTSVPHYGEKWEDAWNHIETFCFARTQPRTTIFLRVRPYSAKEREAFILWMKKKVGPAKFPGTIWADRQITSKSKLESIETKDEGWEVGKLRDEKCRIVVLREDWSFKENDADVLNTWPMAYENLVTGFSPDDFPVSSDAAASQCGGLKVNTKDTSPSPVPCQESYYEAFLIGVCQPKGSDSTKWKTQPKQKENPYKKAKSDDPDLISKQESKAFKQQAKAMEKMTKKK